METIRRSQGAKVQPLPRYEKSVTWRLPQKQRMFSRLSERSSSVSRMLCVSTHKVCMFFGDMEVSMYVFKTSRPRGMQPARETVATALEAFAMRGGHRHDLVGDFA